MCDKTGLSHSYLTKLENNHLDSCNMKTLKKISDTLEVNIKDLFYSKFDIEGLKERLNESINKHGLDSKEALEMSQLIDSLMNIIFRQGNVQLFTFYYTQINFSLTISHPTIPKFKFSFCSNISFNLSSVISATKLTFSSYCTFTILQFLCFK